MKWTVLIGSILILLSCQADFDPALNGDPQPVVFCLLDLNSENQYLRLSKTFSPQNSDLQNTPIEVDLWSDEALIYAEEIQEQGKGSVYFFQKASKPTEADSGLFRMPSYDLYVSSFTPKPDTPYALYVFIPEAGIHCYAETQTIGTPLLIDPAPYPGRTISFSSFDDYPVQFFPAVNTGYHECYFQFGDWKFGRGIYRESLATGSFVTLSAERFFKNLVPENILGSTEFHLISYGSEVAVYNSLNSSSEGSWSNPSYSSFFNGVGLFSSRSHLVIPNLHLSRVTQELISSRTEFHALNPTDPEQLKDQGILEFNFALPPSLLPEGKIHRLELLLARSADSLYRNLFFADINVTDSRDIYQFLLPPGNYYYKAGITCGCLADSCLWDGFPVGQWGSRFSSNRFSIYQGAISKEKPDFQ